LGCLSHSQEERKAKFSHSHFSVSISTGSVADWKTARQDGTAASWKSGRHHHMNQMDVATALDDMCKKLLNNYTPVDYDNKPHPSDVWPYVGGQYFTAYDNEVKKYTTNGVYHEDEHSKKGTWYNSCAFRVSVALAQSGIDLADAQVTGMKGRTDILPPDGYAIVSARGMTTFFAKLFGSGADVDSRDEYLYQNPGQDIICFGGQHVNNGSNHVGMCQGTEGSSAGGITEKVWMLHRPTWGEPVNSPL